jgi:hypothetical protein
MYSANNCRDGSLSYSSYCNRNSGTGNLLCHSWIFNPAACASDRSNHNTAHSSGGRVLAVREIQVIIILALKEQHAPHKCVYSVRIVVIIIIIIIIIIRQNTCS